MPQQHRLKLIMLAVILLNLIPTPALAEGEPRLTLSIETLPVVVGQELVVAVRVADISPAVKVEARLAFDPTALAVVALDHGDFLSPNPDADAFVLQKNFGNQSGIINYALWLKPGQPAAAGNGLLATVTFQALTDGPAAIEIQEGRFFSPDKVEMIAATENVQFTIGGGTEVDRTLAAPERSAPTSPAVQEAAAPIAPPVQEQPSSDRAANTDHNPVMTGSSPAVQEASAPIAPPVQEQPRSDRAANTDHNPVMTGSSPAVQEQPIQALPAKGVEPKTVTGPQRGLEPPDPSVGPYRFKIQPQSNPGYNWLPLLLIAGLGAVVLSIGTFGFMGIAGAWFWLARSRWRLETPPFFRRYRIGNRRSGRRVGPRSRYVAIANSRPTAQRVYGVGLETTLKAGTPLRPLITASAKPRRPS